MPSSFEDTQLLNERIEEYREYKTDSSYMFLKDTAKRNPFPFMKNRAREVLAENGVRV